MKKYVTVFMVLMSIVLNVQLTAASVSNYKSQLNSKEKQLYKIMEKHYAQKQSTRDCQIGIMAKSTEKNSTKLQVIWTKRIQMAYSALVREHPEIYWSRTLKIACKGYNDYKEDEFVSGRVESATVYLSGTTPHKKKNISAFNKGVKKAVKKIDSYAGKNAGKTARIRAINRWICENTSYNWNYASNTSDKYEYLHNAYGVFVKKAAVCDGYAGAFKVLCNYYGIPCFYVTGYACGNSGSFGEHAWNLVRIKKRWYIVDTTWNETNKSTKWLMCGSSTVKNTHIVNRKKLDVLGEGRFKLPTISKTNY